MMYVVIAIVLLALLAQYDAKAGATTVKVEDREVRRSTRLLYQALHSPASER